jgi:hypothetical protein
MRFQSVPAASSSGFAVDALPLQKDIPAISTVTILSAGHVRRTDC